MEEDDKDRKRHGLEKPLCKYGLSCYQKNPDHQKRFRHPSPVPSDDTLEVNGNSHEQIICSPKKRKTEDEKDRPVSPSDIKENIKEKFLVFLPQDFFDMWEFCSTINPEQPGEVFAELGLHLVGPYDVLAKKLRNEHISSDNILCHWRYFYDPPEFQTVVKRDGNDLYHIGYFRDDPSEMPSAVVSNSAAIGPKIKLVGDNIFAAMNFELKCGLNKGSKKSLKDKYSQIQVDLQKFAKSRKYSLEAQTPKTKARDRKVMGKTFHGFGIVVPYDKKNDVGYRPVPESDSKLKALLAKIAECKSEDQRMKLREKLDEIFTNLQFANDECDYGMGLELGIDIFCFGDTYFHSDIRFVLPLAYELLGRSRYAQIINAHLKNRKKGDALSIIDE